MENGYNGIVYLEEGDIIELEGKKYYFEYFDGCPCRFCALRDGLCQKFFVNTIYDCSLHCVYAISADKIIQREEEKIKESNDLINRLV